jgi:hypothetical protein
MIRIREVTGSYLIRGTRYSEILCGYSQSVWENTDMSPRLCHYHFLPISNSSVVIQSDVVWSELYVLTGLKESLKAI